MSCGVGPWRIRRHDTLAKLIAAVAQAELRAIVSTSNRLSSSSHSGTKTDIVIEANGAEPPITTLDVTVSCPTLPSYVTASASDATAIFTARDREKSSKHLPGCAEQLRSYITVVITTYGGIGPAAARDYMESFFHQSYTAELLAGGTGSLTARRRQDLYLRLHTSLVRSTLAMVRFLTTPPGAGTG